MNLLSPVISISILFNLLILKLLQLIHENLFDLRHPFAFNLHRGGLKRVNFGAPLKPHLEATWITANRLRQADE